VRKINSVTEKIFILPASSFCAGGEKGHDACQVSEGANINIFILVLYFFVPTADFFLSCILSGGSEKNNFIRPFYYTQQ
jgi:hypothetical protein